MTEKLYYWAENLENYNSDNEQDYDEIIEIKRLNFFIGKNNAGKSRFLRNLFISSTKLHKYQIDLYRKLLVVDFKLKNLNEYNNIKIKKSYQDFIKHLNSLSELLNTTNNSVNNLATQFRYCLDCLSNLNLLNMISNTPYISNLESQFSEQYQNTLKLNIGDYKFFEH